MKKVLFVLSSMNIGGVEKSLLSLLSTMEKDKYDVRVLLLEKKGGFLEMLPEWVKVEEATWFKEIQPIIMQSPYQTIQSFIKKFQWIKGLRFLYGYMMDQKGDNRFKYYEQIMRWIPELSDAYDIAIAYAAPTEIIDIYIAFKVKAKEKISWIHFDVSKFPINHSLYDCIWEKFDKLYVVSEEACRQLIKKFPSKETKCQVVYNVISPDLIREMANEVPQVTFNQHYFNIVTVGRLSKEKGQDLAIEALNVLKSQGYKVHWYCIGSGSARKQYEALVQKYRLENDFFFIEATVNPYPYMRQADLYVQPSRHDGYCLTLAEALCLEKKVVATKFAGALEQINDGENGYLINYDVQECVVKIKELLSLVG